MKLQYYTTKQGQRINGIWVPERQCFVDIDKRYELVLDVLYGDQASSSMSRQALRQWMDQGAHGAIEIDIENVRIDVAIPFSPSKIVCLGKSYAAHAREFDGHISNEPDIFMKAPSALSGVNDDVLRPPACQKLDYEVELALVIKSRMKNVSPEIASTGIMGYTLMCDYSERANQLEHGSQWTKGKSYDSFAPLGPVLITPDEIPDVRDLSLQLMVNGDKRQWCKTSSLIAPIPHLVAYISQFMTLCPGDIISTGTPAGVAMGMAEPAYLEPGDLVEWGCHSIGWAKQRVVQD
ncbi:MAG: fumarylacetoacetate hydrolase family protein [Akkermansia sp.]